MYASSYYGGNEYASKLAQNALLISVSEAETATDVITMAAPLAPPIVIDSLNPLKGFWAKGLLIR